MSTFIYWKPDEESAYQNAIVIYFIVKDRRKKK